MPLRLSDLLSRLRATPQFGALVLLVVTTLVTGVAWGVAHVRAGKAAERSLAQQAEMIRQTVVQRVEDYTLFLAQCAEPTQARGLESRIGAGEGDGVGPAYLPSAALRPDSSLADWLRSVPAGGGPRLSPALLWPDGGKPEPMLALPAGARDGQRAKGFVYLPLALDELLQDIPGVGRSGVSVQLSDVSPGSQPGVLFRSSIQISKDAPRISLPIELPGRTWSLEVAGHPPSTGFDPAYMGVLGLGINGLLFIGVLALRRQPEPTGGDDIELQGAESSHLPPSASEGGGAAERDRPGAQSRFFSHVSEEIRGALQTITLSTRLCLDARVSELQREYLECSLRTSSQLVDTLSGVLDLLMIEAGELRVAEESFEVRPLILELAELTETWLQGKDVRLAWSMADDVPGVLQGDRSLLYKALFGLCRNAARFSNTGEIRIDCRLARWEGANAVLDFCVEGSSADDPGARQTKGSEVPEDMAGSVAGPGFGLAVSRRLVELLGGTLWVGEASGGGSVVHFTLPFAPATSTSAKRQEPHSVMRRRGNPWQVTGAPLGAHVLVVDDNSVNRYVAREMLTRMGLSVSEASTGLDALQRLREGGVDLVLMDLRMPDMGGCEAVRLVRGIPALRALPIIAMTANASPAVAAECRDSGMDDLLIKPVDPASLGMVLSRHLGRPESHVSSDPGSGPLHGVLAPFSNASNQKKD